MQDKQPLVSKLFLIVSIVGALFVLTEMVLRSFSQSICSAGDLTANGRLPSWRQFTTNTASKAW